MPVPELNPSSAVLPQITGSFEDNLSIPTDKGIYTNFVEISNKKDEISSKIQDIKNHANYATYQASIESILNEIEDPSGTGLNKDVLDTATELANKAIKASYFLKRSTVAHIGFQTISQTVSDIISTVSPEGESPSSPLDISNSFDTFTQCLTSLLQGNFYTAIIDKQDDCINELNQALTKLDNSQDPTTNCENARDRIQEAKVRANNKIKALYQILDTIVYKSNVMILISSTLSLPSQIINIIQQDINLDSPELSDVKLKDVIDKSNSFKQTNEQLPKNDLKELQSNFRQLNKKISQYDNTLKSLFKIIENIDDIKTTIITNINIVKNIQNNVTKINLIRQEVLEDIAQMQNQCASLLSAVSSLSQSNNLKTHVINSLNSAQDKLNSLEDTFTNQITELSTEDLQNKNKLIEVKSQVESNLSNVSSCSSQIQQLLKLKVNPDAGFINNLCCQESMNQLNIQDKIDGINQNLEFAKNQFEGDCDSIDPLPFTMES